MTADGAILTASDGPVTELVGAAGHGAAVLVCEHASNRLPAALGDLGLGAAALESHIAWDPGARAVALRLSESLDMPLLMPRFSRLAYDCNRPPGRDDAVAERSEGTDVPGNAGLSPAARAARAESFHDPFHAALDALLDEALAAGSSPALITVHSFTPVFFGKARDVELGFLHDSDSRLADACLAAAADSPGGPRAARNKPYGPEDGVTYTLRKHAVPRGLPNVMLEVRNDLIAAEEDQAAMAAWLAVVLQRGLDAVERKAPA